MRSDYSGRFELFVPEDAAPASRHLPWPRCLRRAGPRSWITAGWHYALARLDSFALNELQLDDLQQASGPAIPAKRGLRLDGGHASRKTMQR